MCRVKTPNYELWGALAVDVRVNISSEGWTVNKLQFSYFANTAARFCMAYGPGLLPSVRSLFDLRLLHLSGCLQPLLSSRELLHGLV